MMSLLLSLPALATAVGLTDEMVVLSVSVLRHDSMSLVDCLLRDSESLMEGMGLNTDLVKMLAVFPSVFMMQRMSCVQCNECHECLL